MLFNSIQRKIFCYQQFHTSSPRHVPPIVWLLLKPLLKGVAFLTGRSTRKWYRQLPPEKRSIFFDHLNRHKYKYLGIFGTIGSAACIHYYTHLETAPITGRRRYMLLNIEQLNILSNETREQIAMEYSNNMLSDKSAATQLVARVAKKILHANLDIPQLKEIKWSVRVINTEQVQAFAIPSGDIYVARGLLEKLNNEDQLAIVLSHELSHAILGHGNEKISHSRLVDVFTIFAPFFIWAIFPTDWTSFLTNYIFEKYVKYSLKLPYSRQIEEEADEVGLMLAAKACFDVRESVKVFQIFQEVDHFNGATDFFSTHPTNIKRVQMVKEKLPWALDIRLRCNCKPLPEKILVNKPNLSTNSNEKK